MSKLISTYWFCFFYKYKYIKIKFYIPLIIYYFHNLFLYSFYGIIFSTKLNTQDISRINILNHHQKNIYIYFVGLPRKYWKRIKHCWIENNLMMLTTASSFNCSEKFWFFIILHVKCACVHRIAMLNSSAMTTIEIHMLIL